MTGVNGVNGTGNINININDIGSGSVQLMFAKLQLTLAELSKNSASDYMGQIQSSQDEQKKISQMTQTVRQLLADLEASGGTDFPPEIIDYMEQNGLALPASIVQNAQIGKIEEVLEHCKEAQAAANSGRGDVSWNRYLSYMSVEDEKFFIDNVPNYSDVCDDRINDGREWDSHISNLEAYRETIEPFTADDLKTVITSLQARLDSVGTDTQQKMVFVQDFMGQFNSYLQGANSVIQQSNQTLGELARAR
jgi:hypothetical protein